MRFGDIYKMLSQLVWYGRNDFKLMKTGKKTPDEPHRDKTKKMACVPSEDSDQPGHPTSLIRVFAVRLKKARIRSYPLSTQQRL